MRGGESTRNRTMGPREFRELLTHHHLSSLLIDLCSAEERSRDYRDIRLVLGPMSKRNQLLTDIIMQRSSSSENLHASHNLAPSIRSQDLASSTRTKIAWPMSRVY